MQILRHKVGRVFMTVSSCSLQSSVCCCRYLDKILSSATRSLLPERLHVYHTFLTLRFKPHYMNIIIPLTFYGLPFLLCILCMKRLKWTH